MGYGEGLGRGSGKGKGRGKGKDVGEGVAAGSAVACVCLVIIWMFGLPLLLVGITLLAIFDDGSIRTIGIICIVAAGVLVAIGIVLTIVTCVCGTKNLSTTRARQTHPGTTTVVGAGGPTVVAVNNTVPPQGPYPAPPPYTLQPAYGYQPQPGGQPPPNTQYNPYAADAQGMANPYSPYHSGNGQITTTNSYERPPAQNPFMPQPDGSK